MNDHRTGWVAHTLIATAWIYYDDGFHIGALNKHHPLGPTKDWYWWRKDQCMVDHAFTDIDKAKEELGKIFMGDN